MNRLVDEYELCGLLTSMQDVITMSGAFNVKSFANVGSSAAEFEPEFAIDDSILEGHINVYDSEGRVIPPISLIEKDKDCGDKAAFHVCIKDRAFFNLTELQDVFARWAEAIGSTPAIGEQMWRKALEVGPDKFMNLAYE